jgi:hypothetical protein
LVYLEAVEVAVMKVLSRLVLVALVLTLSAPAESRGGKPETLSGRVNTNYLPANLPGGFTFLDGSKTSAPAYVTALCDMTTLRCVIQAPSSYAGKAFVVVKNDVGRYVPKQ